MFCLDCRRAELTVNDIDLTISLVSCPHCGYRKSFYDYLFDAAKITYGQADLTKTKTAECFTVAYPRLNAFSVRLDQPNTIKIDSQYSASHCHDLIKNLVKLGVFRNTVLILDEVIAVPNCPICGGVEFSTETPYPMWSLGCTCGHFYTKPEIFVSSVVASANLYIETWHTLASEPIQVYRNSKPILKAAYRVINGSPALYVKDVKDSRAIDDIAKIIPSFISFVQA